MTYISYSAHRPLETLIGKTLTQITGADEDELRFVCSDGSEYQMWHSQDCCESVWLEDVVGDFHDLIGSPIVQADEISETPDTPLESSDDSFTWTFYRLATNKGTVVLRWYGTSNGYYSEGVDFAVLREPSAEPPDPA